MKKLFLLTAAFATMLFASCEKEEMAPVAKETTVTYTVELPSVQTKAGTKAIGDGFNVDQLVYEVWKTEVKGERDLKNPAKATRLYQETVSMSKTDGEQKCVVTLNLVHDQNYTILFWAQNDAADAYNTDVLTNVTYAKDKYLSNNENMAAFYGVEFLEAVEIEKSGPMRRTELKRPFAQLNIATMNTVDANEYKVQLNKSKVKFTKVPTAFDVAQNTPTTPAVTGDVEFTFDYAALPEEVLSVNGKAYDHYVAMNYIFAPNGEGDVTVEYWIDATLKPTDVANGKVETPATINNTVINVPLKENYRTNIVGNLLTSTTQYEVVIDARWDDVNDPNWDGRVEEVWDQKYVQEPPMVNGAYEISLASELSWLAAQVNANAQTFSGITFKLVEDIDLKDPNFKGASDLIWNPIGANGKFKGTFDGQGHIISNLVVRTNGTTPAGLFGRVESGTVKNVKVVNADVQGHGSAAVVVAHGVCAKISDCHVENATVISTTRNNDDANNVGGIIGYLSGESVGYVKGCSVKNSTIKGYRDVAGIAGTANQTAEVSGNTVSNITVIADQSSEYVDYTKAVNVAAVAGRIHAKAKVEGNNVGENVVVYTIVGNHAQLQNALNCAVVGENDIRFARNISGNVVAEQNEGKNIIINGNDNKLYGKITIDGNSRHEGAETLLIKNIKFETTADALEFIEQNSTDGAIRYPHNVTIENCTFKGGDNVIATKLRQGYNISIIDSKVISGHSLAQLYGCTGVTIDGVEVNAGRGISFGTSTNLSVKESSFNVNSYGLRADGTVATALKIENTSIAAEKPVIVRELKAAYNVEFIGNNTLTTDEAYQVVLTGGADDAEYTTPNTREFNLKGAENFKVYFGDVNSAHTLDLALNTKCEGDINVKEAIDSVGSGFAVRRDVVIDFNNNELNAGSTANSTWYALQVYGNNVNIRNANFTRAGISADDRANVVFESGIINHKPERTSRYIFYAKNGSTITVKDGTFKNDRAKNSYFWADAATIVVEGGNFAGVASNNKVVLSNGGQVIIKGGSFNFDPTAWVAEGYEAVKSGKVWTVSKK